MTTKETSRDQKLSNKKEIPSQKGLLKLSMIAAAMLFAVLFSVNVFAHITSEDTFVRVVNANPDTKTYTFRCLPNPELGYVKDWFIYGERIGHNEVEFLDMPASQDITYTFEQDNYYHVGCIVVDPINTSHIWRGDVHIDLRKKLFDGDVVPLEVSATSAKLDCRYKPNPYSVEWWVSTYWGDASSPTRRTSLNSNQKTVTYTSPGHGLYHPRCNIFDSTNGQMTEAGIPIEFFDNKGAYIADRYGIDLNNNFRPFNFNTWMSMFDGSTPSCTPSNEVCDSKDNDCDSQVDEGNVCTPSCVHATETCNGVDDDCDNQVDEGNVCSSPSPSCYNNVQSVPATCEGGTITSNTFNGARLVTCTNGPNSLSIEAWDKPTSSNPSFFEVYKKTSSGSGIKVCLDSVCIKDNGYAKSNNYPICPATTCTPSNEVCDSRDNDCDSQVDENNVCGSESGSTCYQNLQNIPATCEGATKTSDTYDGCRKITCSGNGNSMQVLACDKPNSNAPSFFEIYRQSVSGSTIKTCIGNACIKDEGYTKSPSYPMCTGNSNPGNNTNPPPSNNSTPNATTTVCYSKLEDVPAKCNGGTIQSDNFNGCRSVVCSNGPSSLSIMACNKPDGSAAQFYELYKQVKTGSDQIEICIGGGCIRDNGYAKSSNYPICITTSGGSGGGNSPPSAPTWIEPSSTINIDVVDFHIHAMDMNDPDGDSHAASDFEIWDDLANQRVWSIDHTTNPFLKTHVHNTDGIFSGNLAGQNKLKYDAQYKVRARYYSNSQANNIGPWSEWRYFKTKPQPTDTGGPVIWSARSGYHVELVTSNINTPINVVAAPNLYNHLPENQRPLLYVTQLYGTIGVIKKDGIYKVYANDLLNFDSFGSIPGSGETGVDGLYVDPQTGDLFVSMVYANSSSNTGFYGKVTRFYSNDNGDGFTQKKDVLKEIAIAPSHHIHTITRGPDGKLYVTTGDAHDTSRAKDTSTTNGKVLRFNEDGTVPSDNPVAGKYFYAGGFRNPFGAAWRPGTNDLYVTNNGPDSNDGIYKVKKGDVYGWCCDTSAGVWHLWPQITAPVQVVFNSGGNNFPGNTIGSMYVALSGPTYAEGPQQGTKRIVEFKLNADGSKQSVSDLAWYSGSGLGTPIGLAFASDGLYFTDIYGEEGFVGAGETKGNIYRVVVGDGKGPSTPNSSFATSIAPMPWYPKGLEMIWECKPIGGSGNYRYQFDFGDGTGTDEQTFETAHHMYSSSGTYTASCKVKDLTRGKTVSDSTTISLEPCAPEDFQCRS